MAAGRSGEQRDTVAARRAVLVLGVHRSGTSAVTGVLNHAGLDVPRTMMPATDANTHGYFESLPIYEAHEELFAQLQTSWEDLAPFPPADWREASWAQEWIDRLADLVVSEFGDSPLFVLKDPRLCRLVPIWMAVLERLQIEPLFLLTVRDPLEVASSLKREYRTRLHRSLLIWIDHLIAAEQATRAEKRHFLSYDGMLQDWRGTLKRIDDDLGLELSRVSGETATRIDSFLDRGLRHHERDISELVEQSRVADWVRQTYAWAQEAAAGAPPPFQTLDDIATRLHDAQAALGPLLAEERRDYVVWSEKTREEVESSTEARSEMLRELEREHQIREDLAVRLAERERELGHSNNWLQYVLSWAAQNRWGWGDSDRLGELMPDLFKLISAAEPADVPQLASAGLKWIDGAREITRLEGRIAELEAALGAQEPALKPPEPSDEE